MSVNRLRPGMTVKTMEVWLIVRGKTRNLKFVLKVHRAVKSNNSEIHIYTKGCGFQEQYNGGQCKEYGDWCQVNCCNMDNCNTSQTVQVTYMTHFFAVVLTALHFV